MMMMMYDPFHPNNYEQVKYKFYAEKQERALTEKEELKEKEYQEEHNVKSFTPSGENSDSARKEYSTGTEEVMISSEQNVQLLDNKHKLETTMSLHDALVSQDTMTSYLSSTTMLSPVLPTSSTETISKEQQLYEEEEEEEEEESEEVLEMTSLPALGPLNVSTEELYQRRIQRSAALGIQRAIDVQKEELLLAHKQRKLEKSDAKSKISSVLSRMRRRALPDASNSAPENVSDTIMTNKDNSKNKESNTYQIQNTSDNITQKDDFCNKTNKNKSENDDEDSSVVRRQPLHSAPLQFVPSPLAAGGYVMTSSHEIVNSGSNSINKITTPTRKQLSGKPSSTLLIQFESRCSLMSQLLDQLGCHHISHWNDIAQHQRDVALALLLEMLRSTGARYAVVRSVNYYVLSDKEVQHVLTKRHQAQVSDKTKQELMHEDKAQLQETMKENKDNNGDSTNNSVTTPVTISSLSDDERLRFFIRFDSIAGAFKAGEEMLKSSNDWEIAFYPTVSYDTGKYGNVEGKFDTSNFF